MILNSLSSQDKRKFFTILLAFWGTGVIFALFLGLGWFFLIETIRRIIFSIPQIYIPILNLVLGHRILEKENVTRNETRQWLLILQGIKILFWVLLTAYVFLELNVRFISL